VKFVVCVSVTQMPRLGSGFYWKKRYLFVGGVRSVCFCLSDTMFEFLGLWSTETIRRIVRAEWWARGSLGLCRGLCTPAS